LFTLSFPIRLPGEHTFVDDGHYPVPPLPGGLSFGCFSYDNGPLLLQVSGFATEQVAIDFCPILRTALRLASLDSDHSITPSGAAPVISAEKHFNGSVPTVTATDAKAVPYYVTASMQNGQHLAVLSKLIGAPLAQGTSAHVNAMPQLALALELYSDCQFAGEQNGVDPVWWTPLKLIFEVSDAPLPNRLSAGVSATDSRSGAIWTHARRAGA
jgi:hypothetical protein